MSTRTVLLAVIVIFIVIVIGFAYVPDKALFVLGVIPARQYVAANAYRNDWDDFLGSAKGPIKYGVAAVVVSNVGA